MLLLTALLGAGGCASLEFRKQWDAMGPTNDPAMLEALSKLQTGPSAKSSEPARKSLEGRWVGRWTVGSPEHGDKMRAIVVRVSDAKYRATFDSLYAGALHFVYTAELDVVTQADGTLRFTGEEDLGPLAGGVFRYEGTCDGIHWKSTFRASSYDGTYEMIRVAD